MADSSNILGDYAIGGDPQNADEKWAGLNTAISDPRFINLGQSYDEENWITSRLGDNVQLRRGSALIGQTRRSGGAVTGLGVGILGNGTQVPFYTANESLFYYNSTTQDTAEVGSDILGVNANGVDSTILPYQNLAGSFIYVINPQSDVFKIPVANPASAVAQQVQSYRFVSAYIDQVRLFGFQRHGVTGNVDLTTAYVSSSDKANYSEYSNPTIDETVGTGDGANKTFPGNLAGAVSPFTVFNVVIAGAVDVGVMITSFVQDAALVDFTMSSTPDVVVGDVIFVLGASSNDEINGVLGTVTAVNADVVSVQLFDPLVVTGTGTGGTMYKTEHFNDDGNGNLLSNLGGTGTINYATGAYVVNFVTPPTATVTNIANYYVENAADGGILDFTIGTSLGDAYTFPQFGGDIGMAFAGFQGVEYAFHRGQSWTIGIPISASDAYGDATNQKYWSQIGIPYKGAVFPAGDGILYLDNTVPATPKFSELDIPEGSTNLTVVPNWISEDLDLSGYTYDHALVYRFGEYNILCCKKSVNGLVQGYNSVFFIQNIESNNWNKLGYFCNALGLWDGALVGGDSISPNAFLLFSGTSDDNGLINNYRNSGYSNFGFDGLKEFDYLLVEGLIQPAQVIQVSLSYDFATYGVPAITNGAGVTTPFVIQGTGSYVAKGNPVEVGENTLGSQIVGGGSSGGTITAYPFTVEIPIKSPQFNFVSFQLEAMGIGWAQIDRLVFRVIRKKSQRLASINQATGVLE